MEKKKYYVRMTVALLLLIIGVIFALSVPAMAASEAVKSGVSAFNEPNAGDAKYINQSDNYYLDMEKTGLLETGQAIMNSIANMLFTFIKWLGKVTVVLFYYCMDFDMAKMFRDEINSIQSALNSGIFKPLFLLGFCGSAVIMLKKMVKRDMLGAYGQIAKVIGIVVLSILVVQESATVLTATTNITKTISTQALMGMQGNSQANVSDYAAQSAGVLWMNLIHQPWVFIEFNGENVNDETIEKFLGVAPNSSERKDYIKDYAKDGGKAFDIDRAGEKIGFMFLYLIPFAIKSVIYILMALLTLFFQLIAIFYTFLAPVVLILSMVPGYEGMLTSWLRKVLESQLSILIMSFIIGLLLKMDTLLYEACAVEWGWLVVMIVQTVIAVCVLLKRNELLGALSKLQRGVSNPGYAKALMRNGVDSYKAIGKGMKTVERGIKTGAEKGRKAASMAGSAVAKATTRVFTRVETGGEANEKEVVERPVMALAAGGTAETVPSRAGNGSVGAQKPQIAAERSGRAVPYERGANFQFWREYEGLSLTGNFGANRAVQRPSMAAFYERAAVFQFEPAGSHGGNFDEREVSVQRPRSVPVKGKAKEPAKATQGEKRKSSGKEVQARQEVKAAGSRPAQHRETASSRIKDRQKAQIPVRRPQSSVRKK